MKDPDYFYKYLCVTHPATINLSAQTRAVPITREQIDAASSGIECVDYPTGAIKRMPMQTDPTGRDAHEPGAKLDEGKPELALLQDFANALREVGKVATFGAKKYSRGSWLQVPDGQYRYTGAMMRHFLDEADGPVDTDSGCLHAAQVAWNALARLELMLREKA